MQVSKEVYDWLVQKKVLRSQQAQPYYNPVTQKYRLEEDDAALMESGLNIAFLIELLHAKINMLKKDTLPLLVKTAQIKEQNTAPARFYNWSLIEKGLEGLNLPIAEGTKSLILAGDQQMVVEIIEKLKQADEDPLGSALSLPLATSQKIEKTESRRSFLSNTRSDIDKPSIIISRGMLSPVLAHKRYTETVDLKNLNPGVAEATNCLEFFLIAIANKFHIRPKQAAALMTHNNAYLVQVLIKGLKGNYAPVIEWYREIEEEAYHLVKLVEQESTINATALVLRALQPGLYSKHLEVARCACSVLTKVAKEFIDREMGGLAWEWFVATPLARSSHEDSGLESFLFCADKFGNDLAQEVNKGILEYGRYNFFDLFTIYLRDKLLARDQLFSYLKSMVGLVVEELSYGRMEAQVEQFLLSQAFKFSENYDSHPLSEQISALQFLTEWWIHRENVIDTFAEFSEGIISLLKTHARAARRSVRESAIAQLFLLLDFFTFKKSSFAPLLFKTITFLLVDAHNEDSTRCFIQSNFIHFIKTTPTIPVGIIIEPLVKQIASAPILRLDMHDFSFFEAMAHHPKLSIKSAISLLDVLARLHLTHDFFAHLAMPCFLSLCTRYLEHTTEFLTQFSRISLDKLIQLEKAASRKLTKSSSVPALQRNAARVQRDSSISKAQIIEILHAIIHLRSETVNSFLKDTLLETNYLFH